MTLLTLVRIADKVYPEGLILQAAGAGKVGDGLAEFIVNELEDTYDPDASDKDQINEAVRVMTNARDELNIVLNAFIAKQRS